MGSSLGRRIYVEIAALRDGLMVGIQTFLRLWR
jgi:hypothetical protein